MSCNLENKLSEIIGQPAGCVKITCSKESRWECTGYLHGGILATVSFECKTQLTKESFGSLRVIYIYDSGGFYFCEAQLLKGKETDELLFACAKDFLPNLKEPYDS